MKNEILIINEADNVAVALKPLKKGFTFTAGDCKITVLSDIEAGHKIAIKNIRKGENIIKYGFPAGHAIYDISAGSHVHCHNMGTNLEGLLEYRYEKADMPSFQKKHAVFMGYRRENGRTGIRNEIWIINTVGCVNKIAEKLAQEANRLFAGRTDGVYAFCHPHGCSQLGDDLDTTRKILAGLVNHPNAAGVLVLGLGCENNNIASFREYLMHGTSYNSERIRFLSLQEVHDEIDAGLSLIGELVEYAEKFEREPCPVSSLTVGLKCGGSDAFSGITANPLVGALSDIIITHGGSAILTEIPEMFGAETILMNRCADGETFNGMVSLINNFKNYFMRYNQPYMKTVPGNRDGGITTLEEKSLGCIYKGGTSPVVDVLDFGDQVKTCGLNVLNGPGNDIVSVTNLAASGAQLILFTTGRGTPLGAPVPVVKISSNTRLYELKPGWIDYNAGVLLDGASLDDSARELFGLVLKIASGEAAAKTNSTAAGKLQFLKTGLRFSIKVWFLSTFSAVFCTAAGRPRSSA